MPHHETEPALNRQRERDHDVSLVIPVYNVEAYLQECLDSVRAQTIFARIEVIIVDDGSTDGSLGVAERFAAQHDNVKVIRRDNGGLSAARNTGIDHATAPTIAFLDSDDVLPKRSIEARLDALTPEVDLVVGDMRTFPKHTRWPWSAGFSDGSRVLDGIVEFPALISNASACNKLFRTSVFADPARRFPVGRHFEDAFVVIPAMLAAGRIAIVGDVVYDYRKRVGGGSIMDSTFSRPANYWDHLAVGENLATLMPLLSADRVEVMQGYVVRSLQGFLLRAPDVLVRADLRKYFANARALFADFDVDLIRANTIDLRHRIAFVALLADDFDLFADRWNRTDGIAVANGVHCLTVAAGPSAWSSVASPESLLTLTHPRAFAEWAELHGDAVRLTGRLDLPGVPARGLTDTVEIALTVKGRQTSDRVPVVVRRAAEPLNHATTLEWTCRVPVRALAAGTHILDFRVFAPGGGFTVRLRPSLGLKRSSRPLRCSDTRSQFLPAHEDRLRLEIDRVRRRRARVRRVITVTKRELTAIARREPFTGMRLLRSAAGRLLRETNVWLLGERSDTAQDNGYALFRWLRANAPDVRAHYVLKRDSTAWRRVGSEPGMVAHGSWRHKWLLLNATVIASSQDIDAYLLPRTWDREQYRRFLSPHLGHTRVFLQHGVTFNGVGPKLHRGVTGLDVFVTSAQAELDYLARTTGYREQLVLTGLPRFDTLTLGSRRNTILVAPTWRNYLVAPSYRENRVDPGTFLGSDYERFYREVLTDPRLEQLLRVHDLRLVFLPHYEIAKHFDSVVSENDRIQVITDGGSDIQRLLGSALAFVTDYSSIMFDAAYLGIPVVQTPFDLEEFHGSHYPRGWFDNGQGELGPAVTTIDELIECLARCVADGGAIAPEHAARIAQIFGPRDRSNSQRVYRAVEQALSRA